MTPILVTLMMQAIDSFETSVLTRARRRPYSSSMPLSKKYPVRIRKISRLFSCSATGMLQHWAQCTLQLGPVFKNKHVAGQTLMAEWESAENSHDHESEDWNLPMFPAVCFWSRSLMASAASEHPPGYSLAMVKCGRSALTVVILCKI
jgi:hypothetical protein